MTQFIITSKGYQLLQVGAGRAADLLQVASSIAEDGKVSQDELVEELKVSREAAKEVLEGLVRLDLIRPAKPLGSTPASIETGLMNVMRKRRG